MNHSSARPSPISRLVAAPKRIARLALARLLWRTNRTVISYTDPERAAVIHLIKRVYGEKPLMLRHSEAYQLFMAVRSTGKVAGDLAEVGTFQGASAKLICEAKGDKTLHLFDTFDGLPGLSPLDDSGQFYAGQFKAALDDVRRYLQAYPNVHFYKGLFPATADPISGRRFAFVNLDVDLYDSTLASLEFFYGRMTRGGIIMSHDYINSPGVRKAFDEFFSSRPEPVIEMSGTQCLVVKA
jgi:hypothetical protein